MTAQVCFDACHAAGYPFDGVEYPQECRCGNTIPPQLATDGQREMVRNGNPNNCCSGSNGLNVYQYGTPSSSSSSSASSASSTLTSPTALVPYNGWTSKGCYVDSVAARVLPVAMSTAGGPAVMTVQVCLDACHAANYPFTGFEYSEECYCSNNIPPQVDTDGRCNMVCKGNPNNYCGGSDGLNVYQ